MYDGVCVCVCMCVCVCVCVMVCDGVCVCVWGGGGGVSVLVEQLKSIFKPNRANCDTSTKFDTVILMGILNKSARLAT